MEDFEQQLMDNGNHLYIHQLIRNLIVHELRMDVKTFCFVLIITCVIGSFSLLYAYISASVLVAAPQSLPPVLTPGLPPAQEQETTSCWFGYFCW